MNIVSAGPIKVKAQLVSVGITKFVETYGRIPPVILEVHL